MGIQQSKRSVDITQTASSGNSQPVVTLSETKSPSENFEKISDEKEIKDEKKIILDSPNGKEDNSTTDDLTSLDKSGDEGEDSKSDLKKDLKKEKRKKKLSFRNFSFLRKTKKQEELKKDDKEVGEEIEEEEKKKKDVLDEEKVSEEEKILEETSVSKVEAIKEITNTIIETTKEEIKAEDVVETATTTILEASEKEIVIVSQKSETVVTTTTTTESIEDKMESLTVEEKVVSSEIDDNMAAHGDNQLEEKATIEETENNKD